MTEDTPSTEDDLQDVPKEVAFKNGFFHSIEDTSFRTLEDTDEAVMVMVLEQGEVSLKLGGVVKELNLKEDDPDTKMLRVVAEGLKYVRELRIGDAVPSELTTGRASWDVTDQHRAIAHNRVTMQLVSWMSGDELLITDPSELAQVADDPKTKEKISKAFSAAAKALNIEDERREDVIALISNLAEELSYIEALRTVFHQIAQIHANVKSLGEIYKAEQSVMATITPVRRLFLIALNGFNDSFDQLDAQTGEILSALTNIAQVTRFIRKNRDDLHRRLWAWDHIIASWHDVQPRRSRQCEQLLDELYHFLAQRFLPRNEWELYSKAMDKTKKRATEVFW
ncbi:hypothetical protein ACFL12_03055 [Pseudomonadota bacterium]